jgi:hypothetical protein
MGSFDPIAYYFAKKALRVVVPKLSLLIVDVDKDWGGKRIRNIGSPATSSDVPRARAEDILSGVFDPERIPNLDASWIVSGRFPLARMPDAVSGVLKAKGVGVDPAYEALVAADIPDLDASKIISGRFSLSRMPDGASGKVLVAQGAGVDPAYVDPNFNITQVSGTPLTARDWSGDFAKLQNLDVALSELKNLFKLVLKGSLFNTSITANTNIFASDLAPANSPTTFRIYACFDTGGVLAVRRTKGTVTVSEQLNSGTALVANAAYMFDVIVESGETVNLQYSVDATALCIKVCEVEGVMG